MQKPPSVLLVCTGNICRSPLAEATMRAEAERRGLTPVIDSAGLGSWHIGDPPDRRSRLTAKRHGLSLEDQRARQITEQDFHDFDHIIAMDRSHVTGLRRRAPEGSPARISLILDHVPNRHGEEVEDPYYGPDSGFETTYEDVRQGAEHLARKIWGPA